MKVSYGVTEEGYDRLVEVTDLNAEEYLEWRSSRNYCNFSASNLESYKHELGSEWNSDQILGNAEDRLISLLDSLVTDKRLLERRIENLEKALKGSD